MSEAEIEDLEEHKKRRQDIENEFRELIKKYTEK
jgi:IS4 transposase